MDNNANNSKNILFIGANDMVEIESYVNEYKNGLFIEAIPSVFQKLKQNLENINNKYETNYIAINCLVTDEFDKEYTFNVFSNNGCSSSIYEPNPLSWRLDWIDVKVVDTIILKSTTIKNILNEYNWENIKFDVVMNVQGAELLVLKGFDKNNIRNIQQLTTEISTEPFYKDGVLFSELNNFITSHGLMLNSNIISNHCDVLYKRLTHLGQASQDKFVLNILKEKCQGYFLEIGSNHPIHINNSYLLETIYDWKGMMVEYDSSFLPLYKQYRPNSIHIINDATIIDYKNVFETNNMPLNLDYLQIDLEVSNGSTLKTLQKLDYDILDTYKFATITFEHDIYCSNFGNTRLESRNIFEKRGYICVFKDINSDGNPYEDWYVHPDLVDMDYVNKLIENNSKYYVDNSITGKTIDWKDIQYI